MEIIDFSIIGGGICGLLIGKGLREKYPDATIAIFEKEEFFGEHSSSRNSGVLHAGIYYPYLSLKRILSQRGNVLWDELSQELNIPLKRCGKYIISRDASESEILNQYFEKAKENQVQGIRKITPEEIEDLSQHLEIHDGFFSPYTGIIEIGEAIRAVSNWNYNNEVYMLKKSKVEGPILRESEVFSFSVNGDKILSRNLINAAGPCAIEIRNLLGLKGLSNEFIKGNYLKLTKSFYHESLVYPIPLPHLKGLGVHTSMDFNNAIRFGPNSELVDEVDYNLNKQIISKMYPAIKNYFRGIEERDLAPDYCGVRSKIKFFGKSRADFWIKGPKDHGIQGHVELCGIDSPGLTSSPAIAEMVIDLLHY